MSEWIALLRAVNLGGTRKVPMAELRTALGGLGYAKVRTLLASGNVVFEADGADAQALEAKLEADLLAVAGVRTEVMVRDPGEWAALMAANPFVAESESQPSRLALLVMKTAVDRAKADAYLAGYGGGEKVAFVGRDAFIYFPDGMGVSKLATGKFGVGTARNWNTVQKLAAMVGV
ncbi:MAG: DUF1697 domain-containing protein [Myxococcota bacterium]